MAELDLARHLVGVDVDGERDLEHLLVLVPVDIADHVESAGSGAELEDLRHARRTERPRDLDPADQRTTVEYLDGVDGVEVDDLLPVELLDVPRVVLVGQVLVELEQVRAGARSDDLATLLHIDDRHDEPLLVERDAEQTVVEGRRRHLHRRVSKVERVGDRNGERRQRHHRCDASVAEDLAGRVADQRGSVDDDHPVDGVGSRIGERRAIAGQRRGSTVGDRDQLVGHLPVGDLCLAVHPADRGTGKDVVELVQEHGLPQAVEVDRGVGGPAAVRRSAPDLGLAEEQLTPPVAGLGLRLRRERAAVHLEVELADPTGRVGVLGDRRIEERLGRLDLDAGRAFEVAHPQVLLHHLRRGAATAVAVTERHQRPRGAALVGERPHGVRELVALEVGVVRLDGREVGEDRGSVDALPPEAVVGEPVRLVP